MFLWTYNLTPRSPSLRMPLITMYSKSYGQALLLETRSWPEEEEEMKREGKEKEAWKEIFPKWTFYHHGVLFSLVSESSSYFILFTVAVHGAPAAAVVLDRRRSVVWACGTTMPGVVEVLDGYACQLQQHRHEGKLLKLPSLGLMGSQITAGKWQCGRDSWKENVVVRSTETKNE